MEKNFNRFKRAFREYFGNYLKPVKDLLMTWKKVAIFLINLTVDELLHSDTLITNQAILLDEEK